MKFRAYFFNLFKGINIIYCSFILAILLWNIYFPTVVCYLGPDEIINYYGNTEYIGKDPYGYFHDPTFTQRGESVIITSIDAVKVQDSYGTQPPYERDWYSGKESSLYTDSAHYQGSCNLYDKFRIRLHWYVWKKYSFEYESFNQFKNSWNPSISMRKEIMEVFRK